MRLPDEHPVATVREWAKIVVPAATFLVACAAAAIAFLQFSLARQSAERQDRAYVLLKDGQALDIAVGLRPSVRILFVNFGKTPAFDVTFNGQCLVLPYPSKLGRYMRVASDKFTPIVLGQGAEATAYRDCPNELTAKQYADLSSGKLAIYVHGAIEYQDIFKKPHLTQVRALWGGPYRGSPSIGASEEGIDAD